VEPKEKLRIKGGFGVTAAAKARVRALSRAASSGFQDPLSYHLTPKPLRGVAHHRWCRREGVQQQ